MSISYGYVRVSSLDQNEDRQILALKSIGIDEQHIYIDKLSGKDFERPNYKRLLKRIKDGDIIKFGDMRLIKFSITYLDDKFFLCNVEHKNISFWFFAHLIYSIIILYIPNKARLTTNVVYFTIFTSLRLTKYHSYNIIYNSPL